MSKATTWMSMKRKPSPDAVQCPASMDWTTPDTAYVTQSRDLRYFCCSEACARRIAEGEPGPWVILPPTAWNFLTDEQFNSGYEPDTSIWQPILLEGKKE